MDKKASLPDHLVCLGTFTSCSPRACVIESRIQAVDVEFVIDPEYVSLAAGYLPIPG